MLVHRDRQKRSREEAWGAQLEVLRIEMPPGPLDSDASEEREAEGFHR